MMSLGFAKSQRALVQLLVDQGILKSEAVMSSFAAVDRSDFVLPTHALLAFTDRPLPIGHNATISAPHMHAAVLELFSSQIAVSGPKRILDVGSGSGYLSVCFALLAGGGKVVGIDHVSELVEWSVENVRKSHGSLLDDGTLALLTGDGYLGFEAGAPYDIIHVGAAAPEVPPALLQQLAKGGRLIIPVGGGDAQELLAIDKDADGNVVAQACLDVRYVPLTSLEEQEHGV